MSTLRALTPARRDLTGSVVGRLMPACQRQLPSSEQRAWQNLAELSEFSDDTDIIEYYIPGPYG